jgi:hypothetical protein
MNGRAGLFRQLQVFFETELCGLYRWDQVAHFAAQRSDKIEGERPNAFGKLKEIVGVRFDNYDLTVFSPNEDPPLGWAMLNYPNDVIEGPLDQSTWARIGAFIRSQKQRKTVNG